MNRNMATSSKQPRLQTDLKESVETCAKIPCRCLFFVMCNAATSRPYSFSEAVCETIPYEHKYAFGSFFENGVILLNNYLDDPVAFQAASEQELLAVKRLLDFIADEGNTVVPGFTTFFFFLTPSRRLLGLRLAVTMKNTRKKNRKSY